MGSLKQASRLLWSERKQRISKLVFARVQPRYSLTECLIVPTSLLQGLGWQPVPSLSRPYQAFKKPRGCQSFSHFSRFGPRWWNDGGVSSMAKAPPQLVGKPGKAYAFRDWSSTQVGIPSHSLKSIWILSSCMLK